MRTHAIATAAVLALTACQPDFTGPEQVQGLRVLSVQAEPPEIGAPGDQGSHTGWPPDGAVIQALRPRVDAAKLEPTREASVDVNLQSVV